MSVYPNTKYHFSLKSGNTRSCWSQGCEQRVLGKGQTVLVCVFWVMYTWGLSACCRSMWLMQLQRYQIFNFLTSWSHLCSVVDLKWSPVLWVGAGGREARAGPGYRSGMGGSVRCTGAWFQHRAQNWLRKESVSLDTFFFVFSVLSNVLSLWCWLFFLF